MKTAVIGLGQFGRSLVAQLSALGHEVIAIDLREEMVERVKDHATLAVVADATREDVIHELGLATMDFLVVAIGKGFEASMMVVTRLMQLEGPKLHVRSISDLHTRLLEMTGVHSVVSVEALAASQLAHKFDNQEFIRHIVIDSLHAVAELKVPEDFISRTLREVDLRGSHKLNLITILKAAKNKETPDALESIPTPDLAFERDDVLVLYGHERDLREFAAKYHLEKQDDDR